MTTQDIFIYIILVCFLIFFFSVLMSGRKKSRFRVGRKRRITNILNKNLKTSEKHQKAISDMLLSFELEFTRHGETDYESMIDTLAKIASKNNDYQNVVSVLINTIKKGHPYCFISKKCEGLYVKAEKYIREGNADEAQNILKLLYEHHSQTEKSVRGIGIAGLVVSIVGLAIPILEKLIDALFKLKV